MISILKNYIRGSIVENLSEEYKKDLEFLLKDAESYGLLPEVLNSFQENLKGASSENDLLLALRDACYDWDIFFYELIK